MVFRKHTGRHQAPKTGKKKPESGHRRPVMCTFTWISRHTVEGKTFTTHTHKCGNAITNKQTNQCDGDHVCRDWNCMWAQYDPATAIGKH